MKKSTRRIILIGIVVILILLIWGLLGGQEAAKIGYDCNFGLGDRLCWIWEKNVIGEIGDLFGK